jgi:trehalose 6-phosphate phosphatase
VKGEDEMAKHIGDLPHALADGDDITDEHAFAALADRGIGVFVGRADDPEVAGRTTAADYVLHKTQEVERFLDTLAR